MILSCQLVDLGEVMETMSKEIKEKNESNVAAQVHACVCSACMCPIVNELYQL